MRFITEIERPAVKDFIMADKTIRCPVKGDFYAMIDSDSTEILSALCITDHLGDCGHYRVNEMRTERKNRGRGFSTKVLQYAIRQDKYKGHIIHANALAYSKGIFEKNGFSLIYTVEK